MRSLTVATALVALASCRNPSTSLEPLLTDDPDVEPGVVRVTIDDFESDEGLALIALFLSADGFPNDQTRAFAGRRERIRNGEVDLTFMDVPPGSFAVSAFHDQNGNLELDTDWLGRPTEPWGVSRDAKGWLGPPEFEDAELVLGGGETMDVDVELGK